MTRTSNRFPISEIFDLLVTIVGRTQCDCPALAELATSPLDGEHDLCSRHGLDESKLELALQEIGCTYGLPANWRAAATSTPTTLHAIQAELDTALLHNQNNPA